MHPALMIAGMAERDREIARRTKDAWKRPPEARKTRTAPRHIDERGRGRLSAAFGRSLAFFH